jgi:Ni,Fe-hydrogenase III large subunit/NADH:ubiquinone oxidoreductase subunit C
MRDLFATLGAERLPGEVPAAFVRADDGRWIGAARTVREEGGRLVSIWASDHRDRDGAFSVLAAYDVAAGLLVAELPVPASRPSYPGIAGLFPAAARMQRTVRDLLGLAADDQDDRRPWLRHGAWREDEYPLRRDFSRTSQQGIAPDEYAFVRVEGDGVHEIPVGPIHAGVIEPGHFRFSVVGEKVLRLEEHLGYTHKGIDKRLEDFAVADGYRVAGRVSGDSTVAYAWAYAQAAEGVLGVTPPARATWLRALLLERERIANHLGDLGALGNDGGFAFALAQFMRLKEDWLRATAEAFGHRYAMDVIVPGGVAPDPGNAALQRLAADAQALGREVKSLRRIFDEHSGLQDRFITAGRVTPELARRLGLVGLGGRASGQAFDLRVDHPVAPYDTLAVKKVVYVAGDVAARVHGRFDELAESFRLCEALVAAIPAGEARTAIPPGSAGFGVGWVEGWRGPVLVALESDADGRIRRCHAHDPSWHNWPVLEHAVMGNIVPDFPLINKSFNLTYSGVDL